MMQMNLNWHEIRTINNSLNEGFEEFVCQLARKEEIINKKRFIRKGKPDAGVECYWALEDGSEWAWQAKYFTNSLTNTQWGEIDHSVRTVIEKHKNVSRYIIAMPLDPPDARRKDQTSMQQKWEDHIEKWESWAREENLEIEFVPWWSSDLIERLQRPENSGFVYFWFNKEEFTDEWFKEYLDIATSNLGERYTPHLNVKLKIAKMFDGVARDEKLEEQFRENLHEFLIKLKNNKLRIDDEVIKENKKGLQENIGVLVDQYNKIPFDNVDLIDYDTILEIINNIESILFKLETRIHDLKSQEDTTRNDEQIYDHALYYLRDTYPSLDIFKGFINSDTIKLTNNPFLLLDGEAGVGKSHLLADVANKRFNEDKNSILLLGQHFASNDDPWSIIFNQLKLNCRLDEFLDALECKAQIQGSRIIIFIDAINEGNGRSLWRNHLPGFLQSLKPYKWLGLVLSLRTSYVNLLAPENDQLNGLIIRHTHYGFRDVEYKASKLFFENYNIEQPTIPLLHPEFQNPLFLKIFCDGINKSGLFRIPDGMQGITQIINFFITAINNRLSEDFDYPESINIVDKVVMKLIEYNLENDLLYIPFEEAYSLIIELQNQYNISGNFIDSLISEGIISKNLYWKNNEESEEGIYIAYERFEDHLTVSYLLNYINEDSLKEEFEEEGSLYRFTKDSRALNYNRGIIEALSIQLPEKFGNELYEVVPVNKGAKKWEENRFKIQIAEAFISSFLWRKYSTLNEKIYDYINQTVLHFKTTYDLFWETMISVAPLPGHLLNADKTHEILIKLSLANRDASWTREIHYGCTDYTPIKRLIDWAWSSEDKSHISDESIRLSSIMLAWFLTSTNRRLRDSTTKALICLLKDRINVLTDVLIKFEEVNDPYIYERLFAVAYGCASRTKKTESIKELAEYIYETIFNKDLVYPHILLRDYARNVIEYALYLELDINIEINKIRPPYNSNFPIIPKDEEIKDYRLSVDRKNPQDFNSSQNWILHSMEVEHTRDGLVAPYGDFGRYVFQGNFRHWKQLNPIDLKNIAIKRVFDLGYDVNKHGEFDREIQNRHYDRHFVATERIGKKYQWIAMYELLSQVSDKYKMNKDHCSNNKEMTLFQGPWAPFVRNIDPTVLKYKKEGNQPDLSLFESFYDNFNMDHKSWLNIRDDYPDPVKIININWDNDEWLILNGNLEWKEPELLGEEEYSLPRKQLWYQIRSFLVKKNDFESIINILENKNFMELEMPNSIEMHYIFNREFYWSPAYNCFIDFFHENNDQIIREEEPSQRNIELIETSEMNAFYSEYDKSNELSSGLKPSIDIFRAMQLKYGEEDGIYYSQDNKKICCDLSEFYSVGYNLIIEKDSFLKFLEENNYCVFWTVLGEKNVSGDYNHDEHWPSVSGFYYFKNNLIGHLNNL